MDPSSPDQIVTKEIPGLIRIYKSGRYQKLSGTDSIPAGVDPSSGVQSKHIPISPNTHISLRIYIPKTPNPNLKLPLLIFFHGGGFIVDTAASPVYHQFLNLISSESNAVIVSVDYRTAPEHPVPTCYEDSWEAINWVGKHFDGNGPEPWLNEFPDFKKVFFAGDSAGANIAHHMAIRVGSENRIGSESPYGEINNIKLKGIILLHPYFWGKERVGSESENPWVEAVDEIWMLASPETSGLDDPLINPEKDPKVSGLGCSRVLVYVAEKDILRDRGWNYKGILVRSGWKGEVEVVEDKGEGHVYFLFCPFSESACTMRSRICTFINN